LELEENAIDLAVQKYQTMKSEVEKIGQGVALRPAQALMAEWFDPLTEAIREEQMNIKF
jgi:DNA-directed RNA polymerase